MKKPTWICGFLACTVLVAGALTTAIPYRGKEGESYSALNHFISELGEVGVSALAPLFNISLMLGGLAVAVFMLGLGIYLGTRWGFVAAAVGVYSGLSCGMVGVLPMNNLHVHTMAAFSYFYSGLVAVILFSIAILVDRQGKLPRWLLVPGVLTVASFASFLALPHLTGVSRVATLDPSRFTRPVVWLIPLLEWSVFLTMLTWIFLTSADLALRGRSPFTKQPIG